MDAKKKKIVIIVCAVIVIGVICAVATRGSGDTPEDTSGTADTAQAPAQTSEEFAESSLAELTEEAGSKERSDAIILKATADAAADVNGDGDTISADGIAYLKAHCENFYSDTQVMEMSLYFGAYISEYIESAKGDITELTDAQRCIYDAASETVDALKFVYYGAETHEDARVAYDKAVENLNQLK